MDINTRITAFASLGELLPELGNSPLTDEVFRQNDWFTPPEIHRALNAWSELLTQRNLTEWVSRYDFSQQTKPVDILVITAGNIPLVGFHDFLSVLISGHRFTGKLSSRDDLLLPAIAEELIRIEPEFDPLIRFTPSPAEPGAVIATGSDNTARYFRRQFGHLPHIIRSNRSSAAILDGNETPDDLNGLAADILEYHGLGCRSVSHLFLPTGYDPESLVQLLRSASLAHPCQPMTDNLRFQRARLTLSGVPYLDGRNCLLIQNNSLHSPVGVVQHEPFASLTPLLAHLDTLKNEIQCLVGHVPGIPGLIPFGTSQKPGLADYADSIDTLLFLSNLSPKSEP